MIWGLLIPAWLRRAVFWLAGGVVAALGIFMAGKREARRDAKNKATEAKAETLERISRAQTHFDSADSARDSLRDRNK